MRIAWIGKKSPSCGNVTYCREITGALLKRNHHVTFVHFTSKLDAYQSALINHQVDGFQTDQTIALPSLYKSIFYTIPSLKANQLLIDSLQRSKFDLLHASLVLSPLDFRLPQICAQLNLPLLATFHQPFDSQHRSYTSFSQQLTYRLYASTLASYRWIIVFSNLQKALLNQLGVPEQQIAVIPNGVDTDKYSPGPSRIKDELQATFLVLYQGRLAAEKNVEALLKAWDQVQLPEGYKLAIAGTGPLAASLKRRYSDNPSIVWMGHISDEQRRIEILRGTDVFILPSLVEGLSLALLEAMACGVACVATNVGCHEEVLTEGAGIIMDVNQVTDQLCQLLSRLRDHPELVQTLGQQARQRSLKHYTLSCNIDRLEALYRQTLNQFPGAIHE